MIGKEDRTLDDYRYLDARHVLTLAAGDLSLVKIVLSTYLVAAPKERLRLKQAIDNHNQQDLLQQTHRIRGSLRYLGAMPLEMLLQRVESSVSVSPNALRESYDSFHQDSHQLANEIEHWQKCLMRS